MKKEVVRQKVGLNKNIATAKKLINNEFNIKDDKLLDKKLKQVYASKNGKSEIKNILSKKISRNSFLRKHLDGKFENIEKDDNSEGENELLDINGLNIDELSQEQIETLKKIKLTNQTLDSDDLITFLGLLSPENRNAVLIHFNPTLSLEDLVKTKVLREETALRILKDSIKNVEPKLSEKRN
ncbi:MAG: hypothetical protein Q9M97_07875 [Candidatus Gracilibacteria bacterium]|nr:hypothetical protein [Candidatus Gracilibacteria bacterium]